MLQQNNMIWLVQKNILPKPVKRAVILGIAAAFCYSVMVCLAKLISGRVAESMTAFIRFAISLSWIAFVLGYKRLRGEYFSLKTKHPGS